MTDLILDAKNFRNNNARERIARAVFETVREQWTDLRDVQQILISLAGQFSIAETHLGQRTPDNIYACGCGMDEQLNIKISENCMVHGNPLKIMEAYKRHEGSERFIRDGVKEDMQICDAHGVGYGGRLCPVCENNLREGENT